MTAPVSTAHFSTANQHALATILEAAQTKSIIASRDIFDISGIKLWARDMPVSTALQRKLLDRQLRNPLESCLMAEDGVTTATLVEALEALLARPSPLSSLLKPRAAKLVQEAAHLPLHSVAQLLLTAGQASRPESFEPRAAGDGAVRRVDAVARLHRDGTAPGHAGLACCTTWARCTSTRASAKPMPTARWTSRVTSSSSCTRTSASC
jgi:hypothetical protein